MRRRSTSYFLPERVLAVLTSIVVLSGGCANKFKSEDGKAEPVSAKETGGDEPFAADEPPAQVCVRPGTYQVSAKGPYYLLDDAGNLPPPAERKERTDDIEDCSAHASLEETFTVAMADGEPTVSFPEEALGDFVVSDVHADGCRLSFAVENTGERYMLARSKIELDFSDGKVVGQAKDLFFEVKLDGEVGENTVACATEEITLTVAPGGASRCGSDGVERSEDATCFVVLEKDGVECCYEREEDACREAGCALSDCDLLKSMPVQVRCR